MNGPLLEWLQRESESATDAAKTGSASASVISAASSALNRGPPEAEKSNGSMVKFEVREEEEEVEELKGLKVWLLSKGAALYLAKAQHQARALARPEGTILIADRKMFNL